VPREMMREEQMRWSSCWVRDVFGGRIDQLRATIRMGRREVWARTEAWESSVRWLARWLFLIKPERERGLSVNRLLNRGEMMGRILTDRR
jgi:hypothetical protein